MPRAGEYKIGVPCKIDGCERIANSRGLCPTHYAKYFQNGWLEIIGDAPKIERTTPAIRERTEKIKDRLTEQMGWLAQSDPEGFAEIVRGLGYYVTRAGG